MENDMSSLWDKVNASGNLSSRFLADRNATAVLSDFAIGSSLDSLEQFYGRSVFIRTKHQLSAALALIELDGIAARVVLCPPDVPDEHVYGVIAIAEADTVVSDDDQRGTGAPEAIRCSTRVVPGNFERNGCHQTEWILFTSGTTGFPKLVLHTLSSLWPGTALARNAGPSVVWSTFYDIRRYGGLQIFLRALLDGGSLVLSSAGESTDDF
jgi:non-ribosomal peptide synthetase component F